MYARVYIQVEAYATMLRVEALLKRKEAMALQSSHKVADNQGIHTEDDGRTFTKHQTNKDQLLNTNQTVHKCFKVFIIREISIDSVTFIEQFLCSWHCA